jgi:hypothetical protein
MQSNTLKIAVGQTVTMPCTGSGFWFESGTTTTTNPYIIVKPDSGAEFRLKPGQSVKDPAVQVGVWNIRAEDPLAVITGNVIIGNGDFTDDNVANTIKLDASFANLVTVTNTTAARVPVTLDTSQTLNTAASVMAYTNSYGSATSSVANTAINMLAAGTNINGVVLNAFEVIGSAGTAGPVVVLAKATAPTSLTDGDVLFAGVMAGTAYSQVKMNITTDGQAKVPAGKGIWYMSLVADAASTRSALFTVL